MNLGWGKGHKYSVHNRAKGYVWMAFAMNLREGNVDEVLVLRTYTNPAFLSREETGKKVLL